MRAWPRNSRSRDLKLVEVVAAAAVLQGPMIVEGVVEVAFQGPEEEGAVVPQEPKEAAVVEEAAEGCQLRTRGAAVAAAAAVVPMIVVGVMVEYASAEAPVPASRLREQVVVQGGWTLVLLVEVKEVEAVRGVGVGEHGF